MQHRWEHCRELRVAHLTLEDDQQEEVTPSASQIQLQAVGAESVLGATTPVTTVTKETINQLQLDQAWEQIRRHQEELERRDLTLTERRTVVAQDEYDVRAKEAEVRKLENAVEQNRAIMRKDWDQRETAWKEELARREADYQQRERDRRDQILKEDKERADRIQKEEKQRNARIELAVLDEVNAAAKKKREQQQPRPMAAAAVDATDLFPPNLGRQDVRIPLVQQGFTAGRERVRNDSERSATSIARDKAVQTLDHRLGKLEQVCQKMEDALMIMRNQAAIDRKEINDNLTKLFNKLNPPSGTAQLNGAQNLNVARGTSHGMVPTRVILAAQGGPVDQTRQKTTETLTVDLTGVQPTGLHPNGVRTDMTHAEQLSTVRTAVNGTKNPLTSTANGQGSGREQETTSPQEAAGSAERPVTNHHLNGEGQMDAEVVTPVDADLLVLQQEVPLRQNQSKTGEVRVFLFDGSADSYLVWHQQMIAYVHQNNLMR